MGDVSIMNLYCCNCLDKVEARLTDGKEVYPHRADLADLPFWKCDGCGGHVGCHHKTKNRTRPLGCIPSPEVKNARQHIHRLVDPVWQSGLIGRRELYRLISDAIGWDYHTAKIRSVDEARQVYRAAKQIVEGL